MRTNSDPDNLGPVSIVLTLTLLHGDQKEEGDAQRPQADFPGLLKETERPTDCCMFFNVYIPPKAYRVLRLTMNSSAVYKAMGGEHILLWSEELPGIIALLVSGYPHLLIYCSPLCFSLSSSPLLHTTVYSVVATNASTLVKKQTNFMNREKHSTSH